MQIKTYKSHAVTPQDCLFSLIDAYVPQLQESCILVITSKLVSLCEGSVVHKAHVASKESLIQQSADAFLPCQSKTSHAIQLTIKNRILIPSAGIDESNGNGLYVLYPKDIQRSATSIWEYVRTRDCIEKLGILITDSHTTPMRRGVIGIGLGYCGFKPFHDYRGTPDCFGIPLRVTVSNHLDALAAAAVFCMGEGNEQTPFAVITDISKIEFQSSPPTDEESLQLSIPMEEDLYAPLLQGVSWVYN